MGTAFVKVAMLLLKEENDVYKKPKYEIKKVYFFHIVRKLKYANIDNLNCLLCTKYSD